MKLYTRDHMIKAMHFVFIHDTDETPVEFIDTITPIELPSDEEIADYSLVYRNDNASHIFVFKGALWVIEQIKQQGK